MKQSKQIKIGMLASALTLALSAPLAQADEPEQTNGSLQEKRYAEGDAGMGGGAIIGAIAGGPPGLIAGAFLGKLVGRQAGMENELNQAREQLHDLQARLQQREQQLGRIRNQGHQQRLRLASLQNMPVMDQPDFGKLLAEGVAISLHFKTGSTFVESHQQQQCRRLGNMLNKFPGIRIHLTGYADERGDADYNLSLSMNRANAVRAILMRSGVEASRFAVHARGENELLHLGDSADGFSFDRRVVISFSKSEV